jgi:hypothetical protein
MTQAARADVLRQMLFWLPVVTYTGLIWYLSSQTFDIPLHRVPFRDKGVHFLEYGLLAFMMTRAVRVTWPDARYGLVAAWWLTVSLGLTDEFHQAYVPGRSADIYDLAADSLGALGAITLYGVFSALWSRRGQAQVTLPAQSERSSEETI